MKFSRFTITRERLESLITAGHTDEEIAAMFGCSQSTVIDRRNDFGIATLRPKTHVVIPAADMAHLIEAGKSDGDIATSYGCSKATARRRRQECGLQPRNPSRGGEHRPRPAAVTPQDAPRTPHETASDRAFRRLIGPRGFTDARLRPPMGTPVNPLPRPSEFSFCGNSMLMCDA